jgi:PKD repeat protein
MAYTRYKPVILQATPYDETDYIAEVMVSWEVGMRSDYLFEDIRFFDSDKNTKLKQFRTDFDIESTPSPSSVKRFWVKVPDKPAAGKTIYLYFGDPALVEPQEADDVFYFWDTGIREDPNEVTFLTPGKWTQESPGSSNRIYVNNGKIIIKGYAYLEPFHSSIRSTSEVPFGYGARIFHTEQSGHTAFRWTLFGLGSKFSDEHHNYRYWGNVLKYGSCLSLTEHTPSQDSIGDLAIHRYSTTRVKFYGNGILDWDYENANAPCISPMDIYIEQRDDNGGQDFITVAFVCVFKLPVDADLDKPIPGTTEDVESSGFTAERTDDFTVHLIPDDDDGDSYHWDFGDGETSEEKDPSHIFEHSGCYEVVLTVTKGGVDSEETKTLCFDFRIDFKIGRRIGCNPHQVQFSDMSAGLSGSATYLWLFGDGDSSTEKNPLHTYRDLGTFDVTMQVTDAYQTLSLTVTAAVTSACVMLKCYLDEIRGETETQVDTEKVYFEILREWAHLDILHVATALFDILKNFYKDTAVAAVAGAEAKIYLGISHVEGEDTLTGFSGLLAGELEGASVVYVEGGDFNMAKVLSNSATEATIVNGESLPEFSASRVLITLNNGNAEVDLSSIDMVWNENPFWYVQDGGGQDINPVPVDFNERFSSISGFEDRVYRNIKGQKLILSLGDGAVLPGHLMLGIYRKPRKAQVETDCIDMPAEYHNLPQLLTMARIYRELGNEDAAAECSLRYARTFKGIMESAERMEKLN